MSRDAERTPGEQRFWALADPLLRQAGVTRSTMMGFPCLRLDGDFFASCDRRNGHLVVKLNELLVNVLIDDRQGRAVRAQRPTIPGMGQHPPEQAPKLATAPR